MIIYPTLETTIQNLIQVFNTIQPERKSILSQLTDFVSARSKTNTKAELIFICTHNSRRSHISQIWAQVAAAYYGIPNVVSYSGGTEATAFNLRAVQAMEALGFKLTKTSDDSNPVYKVSFAEDIEPIVAFSKRYDADSNPKNNFAAIMTCSHADENCPVVSGMQRRISLPYDDPKDFDGTSQESEKYIERVKEIGKELLFAFSRVNV